MKEDIKSAVQKVISEQMRKVAQAISPEQRKRNAIKAWQTRRANIAKTISGQS